MASSQPADKKKWDDLHDELEISDQRHIDTIVEYKDLDMAEST
jgi:hypothetical protein